MTIHYGYLKQIDQLIAQKSGTLAAGVRVRSSSFPLILGGSIRMNHMKHQSVKLTEYGVITRYTKTNHRH